MAKDRSRAEKALEVPRTYSHDWITALDNRTRLSRAIQDRLRALEQDLGGAESLSYQYRSLCKRVVWLECLLEQREAALARGEEVDEGRHTQAVNALVGLLKTLGLERKAREVPNLGEYLRQREAAQ